VQKLNLGKEMVRAISFYPPGQEFIVILQGNYLYQCRHIF